MGNRINLDNNATTPLDPRVLDEMLPFMSSGPYNPSSSHFYGQEGKKLLSKARENIAGFLGVAPREILFTSGGTESMNLLILGSLSRENLGHIITSNLEHPCVTRCVEALEKRGFDATYLTPGKRGAPIPNEVEQAIQDDTKLIVLSAANGETGVKLGLEEVAEVANRHQIPLILDGVALLGKEHFIIPHGVTGMGFSSHKLHGPKGVGFAFVRRGHKLSPILLGGDQEMGLRGGTENVEGIIGLSAAISILRNELETASKHMREMQSTLESELKKEFPDLIVNGEGPRVPNTSNLFFPGIDGETLLIQLDMHGVAVSQASACRSGALEPSRVLLNMGLSRHEAGASLRISTSRMNTHKEIKQFLSLIVQLIRGQFGK